MARRTAMALIAVAGTLVALPGAAAAQDERRIAAGVRAGGVDVSGYTIPDAATAIEAQLGALARRPVAVVVAGRKFRLTGAAARVRLDALVTAKRAYYAGRDDPPAAPTGGGAAPGISLPAALTHSRLAVRAFARRVARAVYRAPRDATLRITLRRMVRRHSRAGRALDAGALATAIETSLADPSRSRHLAPRRVRLRPALTTAGLARRYPTVLTVDRDGFVLRLFKRLRLVRSYGIAVGQAGLDTPPGVFRIQSRQVNPAWHVPTSAWAGSLAGQVIPGGLPSNPLKARWLGIAAGVGIHGTAEDWSIGSRASHGCIRMHVGDVVALYPRVPVGTPVLIR